MYLAPYHSDAPSQSQDQFQDLADWHNDYRDYQFLPAHNGCFGTYGQKHHCTHQYCKFVEDGVSHGFKNRWREYKEVERAGVPTCEALWLVAHCGATLPPDHARQVLKPFLRALSYRQLGVVWRWHWIYNQPHLHMMILNNNTKCAKTVLKKLWNKQLVEMGHSNPSRERFTLEPVRNYIGSLRYIFRVESKHTVLPPHECPPRIQGQRWSYGGCNRAFKTYFNQGRQSN